MKYLFSILLISGSVLAAKPFNISMIDEVKDIEHDALMGEVRVSLWGTDKLYRMDESHSAIPCLEEAFKSQEQVALSFDQSEQVIVGCRPLSEIGE